jgi:hypothetical protein
VVEFCLHLGNASELDIESLLHRFDRMFEMPDPLSICGWRAVSPDQAGADDTSLIGGASEAEEILGRGITVRIMGTRPV